MRKKIAVICVFICILFLKPYIDINYSNDIDKNLFNGLYSFGYTCGNCSNGNHSSCSTTTKYDCGLTYCCCGNIIEFGYHSYDWKYRATEAGCQAYCYGCGTDLNLYIHKFDSSNTCTRCGYHEHVAISGWYATGENGCRIDYCCGGYILEIHFWEECCINGNYCTKCGYRDHTCHECSYNIYCCDNGWECSCGAKDHSTCHTHSYNYYCCENGYECSCGAKDHSTCHTHSYSSATCTKPPTCSCGATSGSALGHNYSGTVTCNVNGSTDSVKCTHCSSTTTKTCVHSITVTVTSNEGGSVTGGTTCKPGTTVSITATPSTGYSFVKWTTTSGTLSNSTSANTTIKTSSSNLTVTAEFTNSYTLSVNPNGGTWNNTTSTSTFTQNYNTTKTITNPTPPSGHKVTFNGNGGTPKVSSLEGIATFNGWVLSGAGTFSGTTYTFGVGTGTLTANYIYSGSVTLPSATKYNYAFKGWYDAATGGNKIGNAGESYTPSNSITLYAQWSDYDTPQFDINMLTPAVISKNGTIIYEVTLNNNYYLLDKTKIEVSPTFDGTLVISDIDSNNKITISVTNNGLALEGEYKLIFKEGAIYKDSCLSVEVSSPTFRVNTTVKGEIRYSTMSPTRGSVIATFVPNYDGLKSLKTISVENQSGFSYIFTSNGKYTFNVKDSLGNTDTFTAEVNWIVSDQGIISVDYSVLSGGTIFTKVLVKSAEKWKLDTAKPIELIIKDSSGIDVTSNGKINVISIKKYESDNASEIINFNQEMDAGIYEITVAIGKAFVDSTKTYQVKLDKVNIINANTLESGFINGVNLIQVKVYRLFKLD